MPDSYELMMIPNELQQSDQEKKKKLSTPFTDGKYPEVFKTPM